jgi:hypothetical protein
MRHSRLPLEHLILLFVLSQANSAIAQDGFNADNPRIELSTVKLVYRLYEPLMLNVSVTNVSDQPQRYYALRPLGVILRFRFTDPDGARVHMYPGPAESIGIPGPSSPTLPGQTISKSILISDLYPITARPGQYTLEADVVLQVDSDPPDPFSGGQGMLQITVVSPGDSRLVQDIMEPYGAAMAAVRGASVPDARTVDAFERLLSLGDPAVEYLVEPALYYLAEFNSRLPLHSGWVWAMPDQHKIDIESHRPTEKAVQQFEELLSRFPDSAFAPMARAQLRTARSNLGRRNEDRHR